MIEEWVRRYFPGEQVAEALAILSCYGKEEWHREQRRVKRDAVIVSRGSLEALRDAISLADRDYRDVLIGEEVDEWLIGELRKYEAGPAF
jgi:hypothetical protein